ncbi:PAS domain-containing protein [Halobacteria archaeon HArc-gm2]|nr:PAS domain-containing protein [Halobacteria archaeon HArc-gm2]
MSEPEAPAVSFPLKERAMDEAPVGITITDATQPDNPLIYVNEAFERVTGYPREEVLGRNCRLLQGPETREEPVRTLREAVDAGESVTVELRNYRRDGEEFWNEVTIAPIEGEDGEPVNFVGFQNDVTRRKAAEMALEDERERLDVVFRRVERLLDAVTTAIIAPTSRSDLERAVCEGLVDAGPYEAAWIGTVDAAGELLSASSTTGDHPGLPEGGVRVDTDHPAAVACREGTIQGLHGLSDGNGGAGDDGQQIAVPLRHGDSEYGVITLVAPAGLRVDEREATVLTALGRAIAAALSAVETRRILVADDVVDVELSVRDDDLFFVRISEQVDCRLTYEGAVADADVPSLYFTATGAPVEAILEAAADCQDVVAVSTVIEDGEQHLLEFELGRDPLVGRLAAFGAETRSIVAEEGEASVEFTLPAGADLRSLVERVREEYPDTELRSTAHRERPPETKQEFFTRVETALTDRQLAALQTAFVGGFFDRPRRATGDELAASMDLTRSTFHQHLRVAQRKLLAEFFER